MITMALAGLSDPRHRALLAPLARRRAGIRVVGACDPEPMHDHIGVSLSVDPTLTQMLARTEPSLVVLTSGGTEAIVESLRAGANVLAAPPLATTDAGLDELVALAEEQGRTLSALHLQRGHATSRLAHELVSRGKLGAVREMVVFVSEALPDDELEILLVDMVDLFCWLTGARTGTVVRRADPGAADGEILTLEADTDQAPVRLEIGHGPLPGTNPVGVHLAGEHGSVEWQVRTGSFRSHLGGAEPVSLHCERPEVGINEWAVAHLIRRPATSGPTAVAASRILVAAAASRDDGTPRPWRI